MNEKIIISHTDLCIATAKRFNDKLAIYEYKSSVSREEPDVLVFGFNHTILFEIKTSMADFKKDQYKEARKKIRLHWNVSRIPEWVIEKQDRRISRQWFQITRERPELIYVEPKHLGNQRYYVCPWGVIPVEEIPEGWGLYYYRNGKFFCKKYSNKFRSNYRKEIDLALHAMRRFASGDNTGILINTYGGKPE
jgi:hypothetical protein